MAGGEKRAGRLAAEPLLAPVIRVTGAEATSYSMTPRSPGGGADGPRIDRRTPTVIVSHTTPDDVPAGGVYTFVRFVRSPREAAEVAIRLAGGEDVDVFSASIGGQLLRAGLVDEVRIHLAPVLLGAGTRLLDDDDDGHIRLQPTRSTESSKATHLRYRVLTVDGTG